MPAANYLGVTWGHPSGAALVSDGVVLAATSEERFSRKKNDMSFPRFSTDYAVQMAGGKQNIRAIGIATLRPSYEWTFLQYTQFDIRDMIREQHQYWYPLFYEGKDVQLSEVLGDKFVANQYPQPYWKTFDPKKANTFSEDSRRMVAEFVGVDDKLVSRIEHHRCHALYGYYGSPFRDESVLVVTIDGQGDGLNATAAIARNGEEPVRFFETDNCAIGRIYSYVTLLLGMKRLEHEYKVMGLAPYASLDRSREVAELLHGILAVDGLDFVWKSKPRDSYFHFRELFEGYRFDHIAGGMQLWVETLLTSWVRNLVKHTNCDVVVLSGGVSMNVKAMGLIGELPEVRKLFVPGSGADESLCIGAAMAAKLDSKGGDLRGIVVPSLYLGPKSKDDFQIRSSADNQHEELLVLPTTKPTIVAKLLASGLIIGRCVDRMEFGQRSLGNRALLADPCVPGLVERINRMIKQRDFWMPFAPVVLDTAASNYLENPKDIQSPHMSVAFATTPEGYRAMPAACHPADKTARAQILRRNDNPELYDILLAFEGLTGRGALLNTSFNLHGSPIVNTVAEAYSVFVATELECLLIPGGVLIKASCEGQLVKLDLLSQCTSVKSTKYWLN